MKSEELLLEQAALDISRLVLFLHLLTNGFMLGTFALIVFGRQTEIATIERVVVHMVFPIEVMLADILADGHADDHPESVNDDFQHKSDDGQQLHVHHHEGGKQLHAHDHMELRRFIGDGGLFDIKHNAQLHTGNGDLRAEVYQRNERHDYLYPKHL